MGRGPQAHCPPVTFTLDAMAVDFDYDRESYGDGRIGLLFTPPRLAAFSERGLHGDGHDWERLLRHLLPRVAPAALAGTEFDPESDLFVAINRDPSALKQLAAVVESLIEDEGALRIVLKALLDG